MSDLEDKLKGIGKRDLLRFEKLLRIRDLRLQFALDHHRNTRGEAMDFENTPHIHGFYGSLSPYIVLMGSVQSFKSEWAIIDHLSCAAAGLSVFFVVPKYEIRNTYVQNRIDRCIERVPYYKKMIGAGFFDNVAMKHFGDGVVKYVGSNVIADFKEFPGDVLFVEEVDQCDAENVGYGEDRLRASNYQFKRFIGNPTHKEVGIHKYYLLSDQRKWFVPCTGCGEFSELDWFTVVVEPIFSGEGDILDYKLRDKEFKPGIHRDIYCVCPKCEEPLERFSKDGKWVAQNPSSSIEGYHISMLVSPVNTISGMWDRFQKALDDPSALQHFYNSDLGLPFESMGSKLTEELLERACKAVPEENRYRLVIQGSVAHVENDRHDGPCSMGVDVGGSLDVRVSFVDGKGRRFMVFSGKLKTIDDVIEIVQRYNVQLAVIDALPEAVLAKDFQEQCSLLDVDVWMCKYGSEGDAKKAQKNAINRLLTVDRTFVMDRALSKLKSGRNVIPTNYKGLCGGEYVKEMTGPIRSMEFDPRGNSKYIWTKCKDHQRHADVYDMLAAEMLSGFVLNDVSIT